jgi:hypothetical protein
LDREASGSQNADPTNSNRQQPVLFVGFRARRSGDASGVVARQLKFPFHLPTFRISPAVAGAAAKLAWSAAHG